MLKRAFFEARYGCDTLPFICTSLSKISRSFAQSRQGSWKVARRKAARQDKRLIQSGASPRVTRPRAVTNKAASYALDDLQPMCLECLLKSCASLSGGTLIRRRYGRSRMKAKQPILSMKSASRDCGFWYLRRTCQALLMTVLL